MKSNLLRLSLFVLVLVVHIVVDKEIFDSQVVSTVLLNLLPEGAKLLSMQGKAKIAGKVSPVENSCCYALCNKSMVI